MALMRQFENANVQGTITFHNTTVTVEVREKRPGGQRWRKLRTFQERESARKVYQSFVSMIEHGTRSLCFTDLAR